MPERQRDEALDKVKEQRSRLYEAKTELAEEKGKNLKLKAQLTVTMKTLPCRPLNPLNIRKLITAGRRPKRSHSMTISKVQLDSVFTDPFGKSASSIMSYLVNTNPDEVDNDEILRRVDKRVKASSKDIPDSIHGYEFICVQRDKLQVIRKHMDDIDE